MDPVKTGDRIRDFSCDAVITTNSLARGTWERARVRADLPTPEWRVLTTPPWSGIRNMDYDRDTLATIEAGTLPPTLRFFTWATPTLSYGRLQKAEDILPLVPQGWQNVQRPTGGGIVHHNGDLCLSLCWSPGQSPLPRKSTDQYRWIHEAILNALKTDIDLRMARCADAATPNAPFQTRDCFSNPVGFDLLKDSAKVVGGALAHRRKAILYQGSIQMALDLAAIDRFKIAIARALTSA